MTHTYEDIPWTWAREDIRNIFLSYNWEDRKAMQNPDMLATMMAMQAEHMDVYCDLSRELPDTLTRTFPIELAGDWNKREVHESFRRTMGYAVEEIMEAVGLFKGKPWKQNFTAPNRDRVMDEIGDCLHFLFEAFLVLGLTPEDLFRSYFGAAAKNVSRQNGDY